MNKVMQKEKSKVLGRQNFHIHRKARNRLISSPLFCFITVYELVRDPTHQRDLLYSPILDYCGIKSRIKFGQRYRQVLCANSFTSLAELSLHRAGKPALNYLVAEDRERVKGGEAACEALDVSSVFCYQPASSSCISMYFMLMYFFPPHWVPAT